MMKNGFVNHQNTTHIPSWTSLWWQDRSKNEKKCIYALGALILVCIIGFILYRIFTVEPEVCTTPTCVRSSMELLNHINAKVNPCEDFYRFACGNFLQNTNVDNNHGSRSVQSIMADEIQSQIRTLLELPMDEINDPKAFNLAKKFYRACMNETAIERAGLLRIKQIFRQIGGWPTVDGANWNEQHFNMINVVRKLRNIGINFEFFFIISMEADRMNASKYILTISDPRYSPSKLSDSVKSIYLSYMEDIAILFGANQKTARRDSYDTLDLVLKLAKISEEAQALNGSLDYNPLSLSELQYEIPSISWYQYINGVLNPVEVFTYDDVVNVADPVYMKKLEKLLRDTPKRTLANFMAWHTLQHLINYLPAEILDRAYEYLDKVNGKSTRKPRWTTCVSATEERLNTIIAAEYMDHYFDEAARRRVIQMIRNIKEQFKKTLLRLHWLDPETKKLAMDQLISSVEEIASYDDLIDSYQQSNLYNLAEVNENEFLNSALNLDVINLNYKFGKLRQRVQDSWIRRRGFVTGLNIIFSPKENVLRFPIGLFRGIYYQIDRPEYMNYGILGSIIAHEISHIFIQAEYRDSMGILRNWWSPHSLLNYEEKLQCLANQYAQFIVPELGMHLNTSNTREEDMADLAGMKVAYDTYINWVQENAGGNVDGNVGGSIEPLLPGLNYSPNQLFWISSAIPHCSKYSQQSLQWYIKNYSQSPQQFRVNGPLQNLEEFAFDFGCQPGSKMNPQDKCVIW